MRCQLEPPLLNILYDCLALLDEADVFRRENIIMR